MTKVNKDEIFIFLKNKIYIANVKKYACLSGFWSRHIGHGHRLVYAVEDNTIILISCKAHYDD